ncbi:hypothetical protein WEI85_00470 [Actinomycetes bacterium KLBMP 9797]
MTEASTTTTPEPVSRHRITYMHGDAEPVRRTATTHDAQVSVYVAPKPGHRADLGTTCRGLRLVVDPDGTWSLGVRMPGVGHVEPITVAAGHIDDDPHLIEGVDPVGVLSMYDRRHAQDPQTVRALVSALAWDLARTRRALREAQQAAAGKASGTTPADQDAVRALDDSTLYELNRWVTSEIDQRATQHIGRAIRGVWEDDEDASWAAHAVKVRFTSDSWDDGWFYSQTSARVILDDGSQEEYDFDRTEVEDTLNELSYTARTVHGLDANSVLTVDLLTGAVEHDKAYPVL